MITAVLLLLLQAPVPAEPVTAFDRSAAIAREAAMAPTAPPGNPNARAALNTVLARRSFRRARADSWQTTLTRRVRDWLANVWQGLFGRTVGRRAIATALAWTVALGALIVLFVWLARLASPRRGERPISMGPIEIPRLPGHILAQQAEALIKSGNVREGARLAYQAGVSRLDEAGALRADDTRTPRESLRLLAESNRRRPAFARLTAIFERVWYGSRPPVANCGDEILRLLRDLECLSYDRAK